jgi:CheY-like chemotaxis protein
MPEMDGYEATSAIRALGGSRKDIPIIAMTASAIRGDRERCLEVCGAIYILILFAHVSIGWYVGLSSQAREARYA